MSQPIRVLHLEDSAAEAELIQSELKAVQPQCEITWVQRQTDYVNALETPRFHLILCDYNPNGLDGLTALKLAQERQSGVPVIMAPARPTRIRRSNA
jgi:DNA-binding response OmpR family regulator